MIQKIRIRRLILWAVIFIKEYGYTLLKCIGYLAMILGLAIPNLLGTSDAEMGQNGSLVSGFDLYHNANVVDMAVIENWDAAGWTNRTGSRKIDWEQEGLVKGNITMVYNFKQDNWLPCCFAGTLPIIGDMFNSSSEIESGSGSTDWQSVSLERCNLTGEIKNSSVDHLVLIESLRFKWCCSN